MFLVSFTAARNLRELFSFILPSQTVQLFAFENRTEVQSLFQPGHLSGRSGGDTQAVVVSGGRWSKTETPSISFHYPHFPF